jgi:annexin A7/11
MSTQGTIRPSPNFSAQDDAKALQKAMKGLGTDNKAVMGVLCRRTAMERHAIAIAFKTMYGKDLVAELKSELSGDFEEMCVALLRLPAEYDAMELRHAMEGVGTDEADLIEIMCTRTNQEIQDIKVMYRKCK